MADPQSAPDNQGLQIQFADEPPAGQPSADQGLQIQFADEPSSHGASGSWEPDGPVTKLWHAAIQNKIQETIYSHAAMDAGRTALGEWAHGRFEGSGDKAAAAFIATATAGPSADPTAVTGKWNAIKVGFQESGTGMAARGQLPSITLDPTQATHFQKFLESAAQTVSDLPEMIAFGAAATFTLGPEAALPAAFGVPTAIREGLMTAYATNRATSVQDYLERTKVGMFNTTADTALGGVMGEVNKAVAPFAASLGASGKAGAVAAKVLTPAAEAGTLATVGPALHGRLPELDDLFSAGIMVGGMHAIHTVVPALGRVFAQTGKSPQEVMADIQTDPTIAQDLKGEPEHASPAPEHASPAPEHASPAPEQAAPDSAKAPIEDKRGTTPEANHFRDLIGKMKDGTITDDESHELNGLFHEDRLNAKVKGRNIANVKNIIAYADAKDSGELKPVQVFADADNFKKLNDTLGHDVGDHAIRAIGEIMAKHFGEGNVFHRGGDEFLAQADTPEEADTKMEAARAELDKIRLEGIDQKTGEHRVREGVGLSYGKGETDREAETDQFRDKKARADAGLRDENRDVPGAATPQHGADAGNLDEGRVPPNQDLAVGQGREPALDSTEAAKSSGVPRAYQDLADRVAAEDAVPGTKLGPTLPNIPGMADALIQELFQHPQRAIPGEPDPLEINLEKMNTSGAINAMFMRVTDFTREQIRTQMGGGARPWSQVVADGTAQLAELLGGEKSIGTRQAGDMASDAEMFARKMILQQVARDMKARTTAFLSLGEGATDAQKADFMAAMERSSAVVAAAKAEYKGAGADIARALNAMKILKGTSDQADAIQTLMDKYAGDPQKLAQMLDSVSDPAGIIKLVPEMTRASAWSQLMEFWKAVLLGPIAWTKKGLSDTVMALSRPLVDTVALAWNQLESPERRMSVAEPIARVIGNVMGVSEGVKRAVEQLKLESMGGPAENQGAIPGLAGEIVRAQFRPLKAVTVLAQAIQESGETYALAAHRASAEGLNPATREFIDKVAEYAVNPLDSDLPGIEKFGKRMTFGADLNQFGKNFQKMVGSEVNIPGAGPVKPLQVVFPFTKIPINVFDEQVRLSPLAFLSQDWQKDFSEGGPARSKALAEWTVGMGLTGLGLAWAASGRISGAGDPDPNKRRVAMAAGWQPYSVKIGDKWYSMKNIHPVGTLIGLAADIHEISQFMEGDESSRALATVGQAFAHSVTEQTMLQGMSMFVEALNAPERGVEHLLQGYASSVVPATVAQIAATLDPYQREIQSIREAVMNRIPGLREELMPKRDPYGEAVPNPERLGIISPITEATGSTDKVRLEGERLGVGAKKAPASINLSSKGLLHSDITKVPLTPEQRDIYGTEAGHTAYSILKPIVNSPAWERTPDILKAKIYEVAFEKGNKVGNNAALTKEQRTQQMQEVADEIRRRLEVPSNP